VDASRHQGLWVTDGTSAGTSELTVNGAFSTGVFAFVPDPFFTVLGGRALFVGDDTNRRPFLWATDGTSAGTSELAVAGAFFGGLFGGSTGAIDPGFTILGGKALFKGYDASFLPGLWVTDGTSAGTSEIVVSGASAGGLFSVNAVPDLTVLNGKVLFEGQDSRGRYNLWVTDWTSAGTSELTVTGTNPTSGLNPSYITVLGGRALFEGDDASGRISLWVTDGTTAGTSELTVAGAYSNGLFYLGGNAADPGFAVSGSRALFEGKDGSGAANLWVTDGTPAGTSELLAAGAFPSGLLPAQITLLVSSSPSSDFNGDGYSDILWQNDSGERSSGS
jgi:ELWxxDGT repeat protein